MNAFKRRYRPSLTELPILCIPMRVASSWLLLRQRKPLLAHDAWRGVAESTTQASIFGDDDEVAHVLCAVECV